MVVKEREAGMIIFRVFSYLGLMTTTVGIEQLRVGRGVRVGGEVSIGTGAQPTAGGPRSRGGGGLSCVLVLGDFRFTATKHACMGYFSESNLCLDSATVTPISSTA